MVRLTQEILLTILACNEILLTNLLIMLTCNEIKEYAPSPFQTKFMNFPAKTTLSLKRNSQIPFFYLRHSLMIKQQLLHSDLRNTTVL